MRPARVLLLAAVMPAFILQGKASIYPSDKEKPTGEIKSNTEVVEANIDNWEVKASDTFAESQSVQENPNIPIKVIIEKIGLNAPVIKEGKTVDGRMGVPADSATVGWWKLGGMPGEIGSAVLAGHYKIDDGSPGVFYRLNEVEVGDNIKIINTDGQEKVFEIVDREIYSEKDFPIKKVFAQKDAKRLNLITCTGEYISELDDYSHRLVVYAVMKG